MLLQQQTSMILGPQTQHIPQSNPSRSHLPNSKVIYLVVIEHHRRKKVKHFVDLVDFSEIYSLAFFFFLAP
jgi:hypothetical protein